MAVGRILGPWGLQGDLKVEPLTDFPERFKDLGRVYLVSPAGKEIVCEVKSVRYAGESPLIVFNGYDSPEKLRELNGWLVKVPQEELVPPPEGRYYWHELIGMEVLSEGGEMLGSIVDIFETGSNDVYVMKRGKQEVYLPATKEVIKRIDRKAKQMVIHLMDGLLE